MGYSQGFSQRTVSITLRESDAERAVGAIRREFREPGVRVGVPQRVSATSIVGGEQLQSALVGRFLNALSNANIQVLGMVAVPTENSISVFVDHNRLKQVVIAASAAMTNVTSKP